MPPVNLSESTVFKLMEIAYAEQFPAEYKYHFPKDGSKPLVGWYHPQDHKDYGAEAWRNAINGKVLIITKTTEDSILKREEMENLGYIYRGYVSEKLLKAFGFELASGPDWGGMDDIHEYVRAFKDVPPELKPEQEPEYQYTKEEIAENRENLFTWFKVGLAAWWINKNFINRK